MLDPNKQYEYGSEGSLVLDCPNCGLEHLRDPGLLMIGDQYCVRCPTKLIPREIPKKKNILIRFWKWLRQ